MSIEIKIANKKNIKFGYTPQKTILLRRNVFENIAFPLRRLQDTVEMIESEIEC